MLTSILLTSCLWLLKSSAYWGIFRFRDITATLLNCLVIAGAPMLVSIVPMPFLLSYAASIALAVYLTMEYTGVDFIPNGLFIPLGIEVVFSAALWAIQQSGIL